MTEKWLGLVHAAVMACALMLGWSAPAQAHAILTRSTPPIDGHVAKGALDVKLEYNSRIDPKRSTLTLISSGRKSSQVPVSPKSTINTLETSLDLPPGRYTLRWQVLAVDGHITRGDVPFTIDP